LPVFIQAFGGIMKLIFAFMILTLLAYPDRAAAEAARNPLCCSICGAPHGNLIGNGICLDCNKREFDIRPNGGGTVWAPRRIRRS
jgi:hypothetical protein